MGRLSTGAPIFILLALCAAFLNLNQTWCKTIAFLNNNKKSDHIGAHHRKPDSNRCCAISKRYSSWHYYVFKNIIMYLYIIICVVWHIIYIFILSFAQFHSGRFNQLDSTWVRVFLLIRSMPSFPLF